MTDKELADAVATHLRQTKITYADWKKRMDQGDYEHPERTEWWQAFNLLSQIGATGPPPPLEWQVALPQDPITRITNLSGLGLNVNNQTNFPYHDYIIDGTGDSGILLQGTTHGCTLDRFDLRRVAVQSAVSWAKHGIYCKARGNSFRDIQAENGGNAASGLSVRMGNNSFLRTVLRGFHFPVTYYEHDGVPGDVMFKDGNWTFGGDTVVWGDDSNEPPTPYIKQTFLFENINAAGPGSFFLKFGNSYGGTGLAYRGDGVTIRGCVLNGKPVTASMVSGVPADKLFIS